MRARGNCLSALNNLFGTKLQEEACVEANSLTRPKFWVSFIYKMYTFNDLK